MEMVEEWRHTVKAVVRVGEGRCERGRLLEAELGRGVRGVVEKEGKEEGGTTTKRLQAMTDRATTN